MTLYAAVVTLHGNAPVPHVTVLLPCKHYMDVDHEYGDRLVQCGVCGEKAVVRAELVRQIQYSVVDPPRQV